MLAQENLKGIEVHHDNNYNGHFFVKLHGPEETPYEGGLFELEILLPSDYPLSPPTCLFITRIYHPNIDKQGRICLDILKDKWTPALQIRSVLLSLQALMADANLNDPLDEEIAAHWKSNEKGAKQTAKEWTMKYATS
jgi:ubiquitin-conjugating enzyme E2 N